MNLKVVARPGIKQIKEYPCMSCGKRFGKPTNTQKGHSYKELMRCMSSVSFRYTRLVEMYNKILDESKKKETQKEEIKPTFNSMDLGKTIIEGSPKAVDKACNVVAEKNTKSKKKEKDISLDVKTGENTKRK